MQTAITSNAKCSSNTGISEVSPTFGGSSQLRLLSMQQGAVLSRRAISLISDVYRPLDIHALFEPTAAQAAVAILGGGYCKTYIPQSTGFS